LIPVSLESCNAAETQRMWKQLRTN